MKTSKRFGQVLLGSGVKVEVDDDYVTVKGAPGFGKAQVPTNDVETVTVQTGALAQGPGGGRAIYIQLVGHGTVLGQAAANGLAIGASKAARDAAEWLRAELARRRATRTAP